MPVIDNGNQGLVCVEMEHGRLHLGGWRQGYARNCHATFSQFIAAFGCLLWGGIFGGLPNHDGCLARALAMAKSNPARHDDNRHGENESQAYVQQFLHTVCKITAFLRDKQMFGWGFSLF